MPTKPDDWKTCPYCAGTVRYSLDSTFLIGRRVGPIWYCGPCVAWAQVYPRSPTMRPVGRLANAELHAAHDRAHQAFEPIWRGKFGPPPKRPKHVAKAEAWTWFADKLRVPRSRRDGYQYHGDSIRTLDLDKTLRFIELCAEYPRQEAA